MQQCTHCQADLPANAQFCNRCGTPVEERQTRSAASEEADLSNEGLEATAKYPAIAVSARQTRRASATSSVPASPHAPDLPAESPTEEGVAESTETPDEEEKIQISSAEGVAELTEIPDQEEKAQTTSPETPLPSPKDVPAAEPQERQTSTEADPPDQAQLDQSEESSARAIEAMDTVALPAAQPGDRPTVSPEEETASATVSQAISAPSTEAQESSASSALTDLAVPSTVAEVSATGGALSSPASSEPEKESTPPAGETQTRIAETPSMPPPPASRKGTRIGRSKLSLTLLIVVLLVLVGGVGTFILLSQHAATGASPQCNLPQVTCVNGTPVNLHKQATNLTFSGAVAGPMSIVGNTRCQIATAGNLRTLTVNLSGMVNNQLYNFGFAIERYNGPGNYSNATTAITILFDAPGESTTNGWSNSASTDTGSIMVERGEQNGSISYTLSGIGKQAGTQIQAAGNWTCDS